MKISEAVKHLEDGKIIVKVYDFGRKLNKLIKVSEGIETIATWWEHSPEEISFHNTWVLDFNAKYECLS